MESIKPRIGSTDSSHSGFCSTPSIPKSRSKPGMPDALMTSLAKRFEARKGLLRLVRLRAHTRERTKYESAPVKSKRKAKKR